jgi:hypothetical protein
MASETREEVILSEIQKIQDSKQTVRDYFENNYVPFSREQYYRYCRIIKKQGEEGLRDKRIDGNRTILTDRIKDYVFTQVFLLSHRLHKQYINESNNSCLEWIKIKNFSP